MEWCFKMSSLQVLFNNWNGADTADTTTHPGPNPTLQLISSTEM